MPANQVIRRDFEERYAKGVGMIYKRHVETNTQTVFQPNQPPVVQVTGFRMSMVVVDFGNE